MNDDLLNQAVANNAQWCDLICSTHNIDTEFLPDVWIARSQVPEFYPNAITLTPTSSGDEIATIPLDHFSVKDSFGKLNLDNQGFSKLFDASWIGLENKNNETSNLNSWKKLSLDEELIAWENAWGESKEKIFLPNLLLEPEVGIYAKLESGKIVAGFIIFDSDGVISVSNVFDKNNSNIWLEIIGLIQANKPIVGYEKDKDLEYAKGAGFEEIGRLTIWKN